MTCTLNERNLKIVVDKLDKKCNTVCMKVKSHSLKSSYRPNTWGQEARFDIVGVD